MSSARPADAPADRPDAGYLVAVNDLRVHFAGSHGTVHAVDGISYGVRRGETVALVGESGSGKSVSALAIMRLLPRTMARVSGCVLFDGKDLLTLPAAEMRALRGRDLAMIFQEPMTSLNRCYRSGCSSPSRCASISAWARRRRGGAQSSS